VEWYRYVYTLDLFHLHDYRENTAIKQLNLYPHQIAPAYTIPNLLFDKVDYMSDDSDVERDTKYNIICDDSGIIEE
jgi:hypothetical protein